MYVITGLCARHNYCHHNTLLFVGLIGNQCWIGLKTKIFLFDHLGMYYDDINNMLIPINGKVWVFDNTCVFWYHSGLYIMQVISYLSKIVVVSRWCKMV